MNINNIDQINELMEDGIDKHIYFYSKKCFPCMKVKCHLHKLKNLFKVDIDNVKPSYVTVYPYMLKIINNKVYHYAGFKNVINCIDEQ